MQLPSASPPHVSSALPEGIARPLARFRRKLGAVRAIEGLGLAAFAAAVLFGAALLADRHLILPAPARFLLTGVTLAAAGILLIGGLVRAFRPLRSIDLARRIEALSPGLDEGLLSAVQISLASPRERDRFAPDLVRALLHSVRSSLESFDPARLIDSRRARRLLLAGLVAWAAVGASAVLEPEPFRLLASRFFSPGEDLPRPSTVKVEVSPGDLHAALGDDVTVTARVLEGSPRDVLLTTRQEGRHWGPFTRLGPLPGDGALLGHTFTAPSSPFEYRVRAGDFESRVFRVSLEPPPRPVSFTFTYRYPPYSRRPPETETRSGGSIAITRGSTVDIEVLASEPLRAARFRRSDGPERDAELDGDRARIRGVEVSSPGSWSIVLEDRGGVRWDARDRYAIQPLPDKPPRVDVIEPRSSEVLVEEQGFVPLRVEGADDLGLASLELVFSRPEGAGSPAPAPLIILDGAAPPDGRLPLAGEWPLRIDASALGLEPGEALAFSIRARDELGQETLSAEMSIRRTTIPPLPEGPGWPESLGAAEAAISLAAAGWTDLLPEARDPVPAFEADASRAERLSRAAEDSIAVAALIRASSAKLSDLARSMPAPTPNRAALEDAAGLLARAAEDDAAEFWSRAVELAGRTRVPGAGPVPAGPLFEAHGSAGARIETVLSALRAILKGERMESAAARSAALLHDARALAILIGDGPSAGAERRSRAILRESVSIAALAAEVEEAVLGKSLTEAASALARAAGAATGGIESADVAVDAIAGVSSRLDELRAREAKRAALARSRLLSEPPLGPALEALAAELKSGPRGVVSSQVVTLARRAFRALEDEIAALSLLGRTDIEAEIELRSLEELLERVALETLGGAPPVAGGDDAARLLDEIVRAHAATEPGRRAGRAAAELDRIAAAEEEIAARLRATRSSNSRSVIAISLAQSRAEAALGDSRRALEPAAPAFPSALARVLAGIDGAAKLVEDSRRLTASALATSGKEPLEPAAAAAGSAAAALDAAVEEIDRARSQDLPEAAAARARLLALVGTLPNRIGRLAGKVRAHGALLRELAVDESRRAQETADARSEVHALQRGAEELAGAARRESDRLGRGGASRERIEIHDRAALRIAAIAAGDLAEAGRALADGATGAGDPERFRKVADLEDRAAAGLEELARAFSALDAGEALRDAAASIEGALEAPRAAEASEKPEAPEVIERDAARLLAATLRAAESIAARLGDDPRKPALLDLFRSASEHFRAAVEAARKKEAEAASASLRAGRGDLDRAIAILRGLREDASPAEEKARGDMTRMEEESRGAEASREAMAIRAELEKLLAIRELDEAVLEAIDSLIGREAAGAKRDGEALRDLAREASEAADALDKSFLSAEELVELVSKLLALERDGREAAASTRALAAEAERGGSLLPEEKRASFRDTVRGLIDDFRMAGFKISSVLPPVIRAYWKATEAADPLLGAAEEAVRAGQLVPDALGKLDVFLDRVDDLRRESLQAMADLERGNGSAGPQAGLERARRSLREAARLAGEGKLDQASRAARDSGLSIAEVASALRARMGEVLVPRGPEGSLASRVLDAQAARLGLAWDVRSRGEEAGAAGLERAPGEMPYPSSFRELIRIYMKALSEGDRR